MTRTQTTPAWFIFPRPDPRAKLRLFCFPYAGGGTLIYRNWPGSLPAGVEVCSAQLPGRGARIQEAPFTSLAELVEVISAVIVPRLDKPFAFFGHSMGAMISFELARRLKENSLPQPVHLFVSGRRAPQTYRRDRLTHNLPESEFIEEVRRLNGTPHEVLAHPELMQLMMPLLRGDFSVVETYEYSPGPPLGCPITTYGGLEDREVSREDLLGWREQTTSSFQLRMLPGDHFFLNTARALLLRMISRQLQAYHEGIRI
jgi:medium-chain acyl-[acyl-carrier-protein] hydrolase